MNHEKDIAHFAALILSADPQFLHVSDVERDRRRASALDQARLLLQGATPPGWKLEPVQMPVPLDPVREDVFLDPSKGEPWEETAGRLLRETGKEISETWNRFTETWGRKVVSMVPLPAVTVTTDRVTCHCRKVVVRATLVVRGGEVFVSENHMQHDPGACPREGMPHGEGYHLCREVCGQKGHAETNVLEMAGDKAFGGVIYLEGHDRLCLGCREACSRAAVTVVREDGIVLLQPPEPGLAPYLVTEEGRSNG